MILIGVVLLAVILVLLFRRSGRTDVFGTSPSSMEILKKRYARGEISKEEYLEMKKDLQDE